VNVAIGYGDDTHFLISDTDERGATWRVAANGPPYVAADVLFFGIGALVLGL
jgi:hypothetical protein